MSIAFIAEGISFSLEHSQSKVFDVLSVADFLDGAVLGVSTNPFVLGAKHPFFSLLLIGIFNEAAGFTNTVGCHVEVDPR